MILKNKAAYKSIGEVAKILDLVNKKKKTLNTHTIRFWEKEFKQVKPKIFNGNRRYYNNDTIEVLKKVKYLLKDQGMTINGAIFIGLDHPVIKSHGGTDFIGFSNSLSVCTKTVSGDLIEKIRNNIN